MGPQKTSRQRLHFWRQTEPVGSPVKPSMLMVDTCVTSEIADAREGVLPPGHVRTHFRTNELCFVRASRMVS